MTKKKKKKKASAKKYDGAYAQNMTELASLVGRTPASAFRYKQLGAPIKKTRLGYPVEPLREWIRDNIRTKAGSSQTGEATRGDGDYATLYQRERALKIKAERELTERKNSVNKGELVPLDEIKKRDVERIAAVRGELLSLPRRLAQELSGLNAKQMEVMIRTRMRELLVRFSRM